MKKGARFRCAICGREFRQENENEELERNFAKEFPGESVLEGKSACGTCYAALMQVRRIRREIQEIQRRWEKAGLN